MQSDRELIELAAKAAGIVIDKSPYNGGGAGNTGFDISGNAVLDWHNGTVWNPLADDGDALRLAVKLGIGVQHFSTGTVETWKGRHNLVSSFQDYGSDPYAATRRAITMAAASLAQAAQGEMG